jgi:hypothetical protein
MNEQASTIVEFSAQIGGRTLHLYFTNFLEDGPDQMWAEYNGELVELTDDEWLPHIETAIGLYKELTPKIDSTLELIARGSN